MKHIKSIFCCLLLLFSGSMQAQEFNPSNPAEPQTPVFYYPLTVSCSPVEAAYVSGKGNYAPGTQANISTSPKSGYIFNHWELNGVPYEGGANISYTTIGGKMDFVAVYDFLPNDPSEPVMDVRSRLYFESEPAGVCTFNRVSGAWVEADQYVNVNVVGVDPQYAFAGWFQGGVKITDVQSLNYLVGYHDETLVARFTLLPFNPISPSEPQTAPGQEDIQTHARGDANEDGAIDVADAVAVTNVYLTGDESGVNPTLADANNDGVIDMADVVYIINVYLTNQ